MESKDAVRIIGSAAVAQDMKPYMTSNFIGTNAFFHITRKMILRSRHGSCPNYVKNNFYGTGALVSQRLVSIIQLQV